MKKVAFEIFYPVAVIVLSLIIILILIFILYLGWHKFFGLKKKINDELENTISDVHNAMSLFKEELNTQLGLLEKIKEDRLSLIHI